MAAPFPTTYFLGIGTAISNLGVPTELSGGSYARLACGFTGTAMSGLTQTVGPWVVATAPTPAVPSVYGLMFDALTGGNLIAYWNWSPLATGFTGSLTAFPSTVINVSFTNNIAIAMNLALIGGQGTSGSLFDQGAQIGTVNGNPMLSGVRLQINSGGSLVAHQGQGQWIGSADVQGTMFFNALASGNINNGIAASATNTQAAGTLLAGFTNIVTSGGALNAVTLPGPTLSPGVVGTLLLVANESGATCSLYPDLGAKINVLGANAALVMTSASSALLFRVSTAQWVTIPTIPT